MDYKYIKQLIGRYLDCQTTREEENVLHAFFLQQELPADLAPYKALFDVRHQESTIKPSADLESRILHAVGLETEETESPVKIVKTRHMTLTARLQPLYRAAASVAIVTLLGVAAQHSFTTSETSPFGSTSSEYAPQAQDDSNNPDGTIFSVGQTIKQGQETAATDSSRILQKNVGATSAD